MSVFASIKKLQSKIHHSQYIRAENKPGEAGAKPAEPVNTTPEAK